MLADASRNLLQFDDFTYIITQNNPQDFCVTQVVRSDKPRIYALAHKIANTPLVEYSTKEKHTAVKTEDDSITYDQTFINALRKESPETLVLLRMLAETIENYFKSQNSIFEGLVIEICSSIFKDEMFATRNASALGNAVLAIIDIVDFLRKDKGIASSAEVIRKQLGIGMEIERSKDEGTKKDDIRKNLTMSKSRAKFIELLSGEIGEAIAVGSLNRSVVLKLDRVFQRVPRIREHYNPHYSEGYHRWFTYQLEKLIDLSEEKLRSFAQEEDTGILRDLTSSIGTLWVILQENQQNEMIANIAELQEGRFWVDTEADKFLRNPKGDSGELTVNLCLFTGQQEKLLNTLKVLLVELAVREKASFGSLNKMDTADGKKEKWTKIYGYPKIKEFITEKLKDTLPFNVEEIQTTTPSIFKADPMFEELKVEERKISLEFGEPKNIQSEPNTTQTQTQTETETKKSRRKAPKALGQEKEALIPTQLNVIDITPKLQDPITYHSIDNLHDCHSSGTLKDFKFFLTPSGNEIHAVSGGTALRACLSIYDKATNQLKLIYLDSAAQSSLTIWKSAAFLYFDRNLAVRHSPLGPKFKDCLLYADLRQSFMEGGETKGIVVFVPMLRNDQELVNRAILADEQGVYLLGGSKITGARKNPIAYSNCCNYYDLAELKSLSTDVIKSDTASMELKRDNLIVTQNEAYIFVASRDNWNADKSCFGEKNLIEIYDKDEDDWLLPIEVPYDLSALNYTLLRTRRETKAALLFIANSPGQHPASFMIDIEEIEEYLKGNKKKELPLREVEKFEDTSGGDLILGMIMFPLQNGYESANTLDIRSSRKEGFENDEYRMIIKEK